MEVPRERHLLTHDFDNDAFRSLSIEFGVIHLLPGAEIEFARSDGDNDFVMNDEALQVGIAVRFTRAVMTESARNGAICSSHSSISAIKPFSASLT
jgi:hypothetical protein